jgi:hypothetical protein
MGQKAMAFNLRQKAVGRIYNFNIRHKKEGCDLESQLSYIKNRDGRRPLHSAPSNIAKKLQ